MPVNSRLALGTHREAWALRLQGPFNWDIGHRLILHRFVARDTVVYLGSGHAGAIEVDKWSSE